MWKPSSHTTKQQFKPLFVYEVKYPTSNMSLVASTTTCNRRKPKLKYSIVNHEKLTKQDSDDLNRFTSELSNWYPIGDRKFTIRFSEANYFDFFKSIGSEGFHIICRHGPVAVGSLCARLVRGAWYFCDLKVHPEYRGHKITYRLFMRNCIRAWFLSSRGYAISMYPNEAVSKLNSGFRLMHMENMGFVYIYLLDYPVFMADVYDRLVWYYGHKYNGFLNINCAKKIILDSGEELQVLHFYHDNIPRTGLITPDITDNANAAYSGYKVFFCILEKDVSILNIKHPHYGMATLYAKDMGIGEFANLGTYEI
jgi:hypothetical protein